MQATQAAAQRLADRTRTKIEELWARDLTRAEFVTFAAVIIAQANAAGVHIADLGLAAEVTRQLGRLTPPLGLTPPPVAVDQNRIASNLTRVIGDSEHPEVPLGDWAASEPYLTVANAVQTGMAAHGFSGWTRQLSGKSCPLCEGWADGIVRPVSVSDGPAPSAATACKHPCL